MSSIAQPFTLKSTKLNWQQRNNPSIDEKEFKLFLSYGVDAVNHILRAANCPINFRFYFDGLLGVSEGRFEFEITNEELIRRIRITEQVTTKDADRQWFAYHRQRYEDWQTRYGLNFIERRRGGGRSKGRNSTGLTYAGYPSKYRLHLLTILADVMRQAQKSPLWDTEPLEAIEQAAKDEVRKMLLQPRLVVSNSHQPWPWYLTVGSNLASAKGHLVAALQHIPVGGQLYGKYKQLLKEIEQKVDELLTHAP